MSLPPSSPPPPPPPRRGGADRGSGPFGPGPGPGSDHGPGPGPGPGLGSGAGAERDVPPFSEPVDLRASSAAASFRVSFSVFDAFLAILAYFFGQIVAGTVLGVGVAITGGEVGSGNELLFALGAQLLGLVFAVLILVVRRRWSWRVYGPVRPSARIALLAVAVGIGGTILTYLLNALVALVFRPEAPVEQQVLQDAMAGGRAIVLAVLVAVVMAPIAEELLFRGLLFQALRRRIGLWPGALLSSAVFTLIHVEIVTSQPFALVGLFSLGVFLAWAFHRTGSLLVPVLGHAVFNASSLGLAFAVEQLGLDEVVAVIGVPLVGLVG